MMLMTSNTPRMTYRIGMRACLESRTEGFPSLVADAVGEVAAEVTGICQSLKGKTARAMKNRSEGHYQGTRGGMTGKGTHAAALA